MKQVKIYLMLMPWLLLAACSSGTSGEAVNTGGYYTCPMHPSVMSKSPGACPVCNMSLIFVENADSATAGQGGNFITIDRRSQMLAGIKTDTVRKGNFFTGSSIIGTVARDEAEVKTISSRVAGRIERLFVKTTGVKIKAGDPLFSIYSETLLADEKIYLSLQRQVTAGTATAMAADLLAAARNKLLLRGLSEQQINELARSGRTSPLITYYANASGYVTAVSVSEGMYVEEGSTVVTVTDLGKIWVEAQVYANELSAPEGQRSYEVYAPAQPGKTYKGTLVYDSPLIEEGRRVQLIRLSVSNPDGDLLPGMMVMVSPKAAVRRVISVPVSAVLPEKMKTVWVLAHDNTFEQRMVETGAENKYQVEILSGLNEGELIVTQGVYLVNSEFILKNGAGQRHEH